MRDGPGMRLYRGLRRGCLLGCTALFLAVLLLGYHYAARLHGDPFIWGFIGGSAPLLLGYSLVSSLDRAVQVRPSPQD